jgi:hypothetical protein
MRGESMMAEMVTGDIVLEARTLATRLGKSRESALCKAFPHKADLHDAQQMILRLADEAEAQRNAVDGVIRQHVLQAQTALNERERLRDLLHEASKQLACSCGVTVSGNRCEGTCTLAKIDAALNGEKGGE